MDEDIRKPSSPSSNVVNPFPQRSISELEPRKVQIIDQNTNRYWENEACSFEDQNQDQFQGLYDKYFKNSKLILFLLI